MSHPLSLPGARGTRMVDVWTPEGSNAKVGSVEGPSDTGDANTHAGRRAREASGRELAGETRPTY